MQETWVWSLGWEDPLEEGNPFQGSCLENAHGQRNLRGYSPWSHKESDTAEPLSAAYTAKETRQPKSRHLALLYIWKESGLTEIIPFMHL